MTTGTALITGASSGIGAATARRLAALGHPVVLAARRVDRCRAVCDEIAAAGGLAVAIELDVTAPDHFADLGERAGSAFGPIDVVVSNAGDLQPQAAVDSTTEEFARQIDINLLAAQRLVRALVPSMIERRRGDVVFVTSDVTRVPRPRMSSYVTSKWGLEGFARALQMELEGTGVRASIVRPGPTGTEMGSTWAPETVGPLLDEWDRWGLMRHRGVLTGDHVAAAIAAALSMPPGAHLTLVEIEPEAPADGP